MISFDMTNDRADHESLTMTMEYSNYFPIIFLGPAKSKTQFENNMLIIKDVNLIWICS